MKVLARWMSKSGKYWASLERGDQDGYFYSGVGCGGCLGATNYTEALGKMQAKIDSGYFQPDKNKTPMKRVV